MTTPEPQPTSQLPAPTPPKAWRFETVNSARGSWPGFPFPPPLLGIDFQTIDRAAAMQLNTVAELIHTGETDLNILFDPAPARKACAVLDLPAEGLQVVPAAALYTLGSLHAGKAGASLSALFAAPSIVQIARLRLAALQLDS